MAKRYKQVFKEEVIKDMKKSGLSVHQATLKYKLSPKTIYAWLDGKDPDLRQALNGQTPPEMVHTDQGSEYLSYNHQALLAAYDVKHSCSEAGKTLKYFSCR